MHVLITGANGFIGKGLSQRLQATWRLGGRSVSRLSLMDLHLEGLPADARVQALEGDMADTAWLRRALAPTPLDVVFHLASIPGGQAERDENLARRVNLDATAALLESARAPAGAAAPVFVFASSIAVFGHLPAWVTDATEPRPVMRYGHHKLAGEAMVAAFSREGAVDGRSLRLPGVLARPPARTGQLSAFLSDAIRELAAGRPFTCPTSAGATTWASSWPNVVDNLLHAATVAAARLPGHRCLTLPTLHFSMAELVAAIAAVHGTAATSLVRYAPDAQIEALFGRFPPLHTPAAEAAGFTHDGELALLVRRALQAG